MKTQSLICGSFFALTAIVLGAFGAHALKGVLTPEQLTSFETGVRYQMYHALALVFIGLKGESVALRFEKAVTVLFGTGTVLFSFSIYLLNLQGVLGISMGWIGPVTPIGGSLLIVGWVLVLLGAVMPAKNR